MSRTSGDAVPQGSSSRPSRNRGGGLLGRVVNGIADYVAANAQHASDDRRRRSKRGDDGMAYGDDYAEHRRIPNDHRSTLEEDATSRSGRRTLRKHRQRDERSEDPQTSNRRSRNSGQRSSLNGRSALVEDYASSDESDTRDFYDDAGNDGAAENTELVAALENAVESHRREAKLARRELAQASQQSSGNAQYLQNLAQRIKSHEKARERALRDLKHARADAEEMPRARQSQRRSRPSVSSRNTEYFENDPFRNDPFFNDPVFNNFHTSTQQQRLTHPFAANARGVDSNPLFGPSPFAAFESIFADFERTNRMHHDFHQQFFSMPGASFTASFNAQPRNARFSTTSNSGPQFQYQQQRPQPQQPRFATFTPQPSTPPATVLKVEEAQQLFVSYNGRWNTVSASDPNVPFPTRGLTPANLSSRNTLWAPLVSSPVEAWSEETVMKANTQAFFLGAVGLRPAYSELAGAKIELGIDKMSASSAQLQQLVEILKKERVRWHSDRLGKRNGGRAGPNQALQNDERARAVYHGVCELIEAAQ